MNITVSQISDKIRELILTAEFNIPENIESATREALLRETNPQGRFALTQILENQRIARDEQTPICQDTGMIVVFAEVGQDARITGGAFDDAIQDGVRRAYRDGYLRASIVDDPLFDRRNTRDNTPAVVHVSLVEGEGVHFTVLCKGFGSENMSRAAMLTPAAGVQGVEDFIVETARLAGGNPCPPIVLGVGVGGSLDSCAVMAKRETARSVGERNPDPNYAGLEERCLLRINDLGIGAVGFGGNTTAFAVNIKSAPTHIAGLPVVVNVSCHATRYAEGGLP
ncbi:fumarate hydratase [Clostridia bacterium]|nr:fumarate hydratase [Clostridia bacterium]